MYMRDKKLEKLVRQEVIYALREVLCDPEHNLELSATTKTRLKKSIRSKEKGRTTDLRELFHKYKV